MSFKTLRWVASISAGMAVGLITFLGLWSMTAIAGEKIIFAMILLGLLTALVILAITEDQVKPPKKVYKLSKNWVELITLDKDAYGRHPNYIERRKP